MKYVKGYRCTLCDELHRDLSLNTCPRCGELGILDVEYDYKAMKKVINETYFETNRTYSIWRYLPMMSVHNDTDVSATLHVGWTPLYRANKLEKKLNLEALYLKDETVQPTGSLKDRASAVAAIKAIEEGHTTLACSSTGNAATSLAGNAAKLGLKTVIFVPKRSPIGKLRQLMIYGAKVIRVDGDYKRAYALSKQAIEHFGWYNRNAAVNPHLVEGKKTVALEIAEQLHFKLTDWVIVSVGDGCTVAGVYKGFYDLFHLGILSNIPKILGVQASGCAPFYEAHEGNRGVEETDEHTLADSIAVGIPRNPVKGLNAVKKSKGNWVTVSDEAMLKAMKTLGHDEGLFVEPAASAVYAGLEKALETNVIKHHESVTLIMTGNGLKDPENAEKATGAPALVNDDFKSILKHLDDESE